MNKLTQGQYRTLKLGSVVILVSGMVGDIVTTHIGLTRFDAREANPIAKWFMAELGNPLGFIVLSAIVFVAVVSVSATFEEYYDGWLGQWASIATVAGVGVIQTFVAVWNTLLILSMAA